MKFSFLFALGLTSLFCDSLGAEEVCSFEDKWIVNEYQCLFEDKEKLQKIIVEASAHDLKAISVLWNYYMFVEENKPEAERWLREGTKVGSDSMAFTLGSLLTFPKRTKVEQAEGEALLLPLAERGNVSAQTKLGYFYQEQGNPMASWWFERAAWRGDTGGMSQVADHLARSGVCVDGWQAVIWYQVAAKFFTKGSWAQQDVSTKAERLLGTLQCSVPIDAGRLSTQYASAIKVSVRPRPSIRQPRAVLKWLRFCWAGSSDAGAGCGCLCRGWWAGV